MKNLLLIIFMFILSQDFLNANSTKSPQMTVCEFLERLLIFQVVDEKKEWPTSWENFEVINMMQRNPKKPMLSEMKTINSFALVPGMALIQPQLAIPRDYREHRLFLISREENTIKSLGKGRCVILIKPEGLDSKTMKTVSYFMPEETAKIILEQLEGFDPKSQPLAFENIDQLIRDNEKRKDEVDRSIKEQLRKTGRLATENSPSLETQYSRQWLLNTFGWVSGLFIIGAFFVWFASRFHAKC